MIEIFKNIFVLLIPLIVGGIIHMIFVSKDYMTFLKLPIWEKGFGLNKTWRGFIVMPFATVIGVFIARIAEVMMESQTKIVDSNVFFLGLSLGLAYILFELPNSYLKRRLGISAGKPAVNYRFLHAIYDQADSGLGCIIVYYYLLDTPIYELFLFILVGTGTHLFFNILLFFLKLRKEPF